MTDKNKEALEICNRALAILPEGVAGYGLFKDIKSALTAPVQGDGEMREGVMPNEIYVSNDGHGG